MESFRWQTASQMTEKASRKQMTKKFRWQSWKTRKIPPDWKKKYFQSVGGHNYQVTPAVRNNVIFRQFNLMEPIKFKRKFDLIFCRNVMIYFDQPTKIPPHLTAPTTFYSSLKKALPDPLLISPLPHPH